MTLDHTRRSKATRARLTTEAPGASRLPVRAILLITGVLAVMPFCLPAPPAMAQGYVQTNLVSDLPNLARFTDPNLVNPWGMSSSATSPIWVSDNKTGVSTIYNGDGQPQPLVVTIPGPGGGTSTPTGQIFNGNPGSFMGDRFIFGTEDGAVAGWQGGTNALIRVNNGGADAVYKGLATANDGMADYLYATDFHNGTVDAFDSQYGAANLPGAFLDPNLPAGYAPFNIQSFGGNLYVTFALQAADHHDDEPGAGHGFLDVFDPDGHLLQRLVSGGVLNSPWGMAIAPGDFGQFSNALLVGNFGDGRINAFNPANGAFLGALSDPADNPLSIEGLWGLRFGNGGNGGLTNSLYFTAGISGGGLKEEHGLFGDIRPVPEPSSLALAGAGLIGLALLQGLRRRRSSRISSTV